MQVFFYIFSGQSVNKGKKQEDLLILYSYADPADPGEKGGGGVL